MIVKMNHSKEILEDNCLIYFISVKIFHFEFLYLSNTINHFDMLKSYTKFTEVMEDMRFESYNDFFFIVFNFSLILLHNKMTIIISTNVV